MIDSSRSPTQSWKAWLSWPTASLRTYLVAIILLATLPFSGLIAYEIFVVIVMPAAPIDSANRQAILIALGTAAGCLLLGTGLALFAARKILRPLQQLSQNELSTLIEPIAVREILMLRNALLHAQQQNQAAQERLLYKRNLLQKRATEFEALFASTPIGLAFAEDPECHAVTHNAAMDRLFGSTESQTENLVRVLENGLPLSREEQPLQRAAAHGETSKDRELELLVDGRPPLVVIVNAVPLLDSEGEPRGALSAVFDITERKAAEERLISTEQRLRESQRLVDLALTELKEAKRERLALIAREQAARLDAEAANRSKDVFLAMLGHELRNPLSAMTAAIEVLNRLGAQSETEISARRILSRQTYHLARMMDDLLDVARVVSGQVKLTRHRLDLAVRVQRIVETLEITGQLDQHRLTLDCQEVWIDADPTRLEQIVNNLVINAIKYTPHGGRIKVTVCADHGDALLEVRNAGNGISAELLPRIFDLFIQGDSTLDRRNGGLGIGLALVRRLVELHGGSICAENTKPGTLMRVRFPAIETPVINVRTASLPKSRCRSVAIIDDNEDVLYGMRSLLEIEGHTVWTAGDGISGLALVLDNRPDVALVDIGLPGLSGFEVAKRSRAGGYAGRMVAVSGYGQDSDLKQGLAAGFDAYILKPIDGQKLRDLLRAEFG